MPESLDDWEREVRSQERTGSPSTILPLISSLLTSCHCSSRLLSPLLQTLLNTINQPNPSSHSGSEEFPLMPQSEVLLDLLDLTGEDFKSESWGPSVTALIMRLRATALASMILQVIKNINVLNRTITCLLKGRLDLVLRGAVRIRQPPCTKHRGLAIKPYPSVLTLQTFDSR